MNNRYFVENLQDQKIHYYQHYHHHHLIIVKSIAQKIEYTGADDTYVAKSILRLN